MNRLLQLRQDLVSDRGFFQQHREASFDHQQLKAAVYGPNYQAREKTLAIIKANPDVFEHYHLNETTRADQRQKTTSQFVFTTEILKDAGMADTTNPNYFTVFGIGFTFFDLNNVAKLGVHYSLYIKTLERLGSSQLHKHYYERACTFKDFGCFSLTELMHGSNVKGLQTEAHYDHSTKQLIIHTPSKDAIKFWIGGAAKTSNMTILWAQLYVKGKNCGVHAMVVPIRDKDTHKVLPGLTIGDCGPKFGLNAIDNGFLEFNHYRIPVGNLLDKISGITEQGDFFNHFSSEGKRFGMTLAALSEGRLFMCCHSTTLALSALAIAIRYTFVRKQFFDKKGERERVLIEYPLTVRRMVPLLAVQVIHMCVTMSTFYSAENNEGKKDLSPNNPLLQEIHAVSSVLKAKTAWVATETIRECRQMMGGHGYSAYSKMAALYSNNDVNNTWEGDNNVLLQQTTKYVLENFQRVAKGKKIDSPLLKFLEDPPEEHEFQVNKANLHDFQVIRRYLMGKVSAKIQEMGMKMMVLKDEKKAFLDIWNEVQVYSGTTVAMYTADLYILDICLTKLKEIKDNQTKKVFETMLHIWTLVTLKNDESINEKDHAMIEKSMLDLSDCLVPEVLGILECLTAGEEVLGSPFASEQGDGFEKYMDLLLSKPRKARSEYWELLASK